MADNLQRLRDAVVRRHGRQVEVTPEGEVREVRPRDNDEDMENPNPKPTSTKPTKLASRTFGNHLV